MTEATPTPRPLDLAALGRVLVVAPHPDDETLGCGGLIALLRSRGQAVFVLFVSDGSGSHPHSRAFPRERLARLRKDEARRALAILGVAERNMDFLGLQDRFVPFPRQTGFAVARERCEAILSTFAPTTVVVPWRRDPHKDHRATWNLVDAALALPGALLLRRLEYAIWLDELGTASDRPEPGEMLVRRLDITAVLERKRCAVAAHRSQLGQVVTDDPTGFTLSAATLRRFDRPEEIFLEAAA